MSSAELAPRLGGFSAGIWAPCGSLLAQSQPLGYDPRAMGTPVSIVVDPEIHQGKPVIGCTRVPVTVVLGSLAGGMSFEEIQREYDLSLEAIRAALKFAVELVDQVACHRP